MRCWWRCYCGRAAAQRVQCDVEMRPGHSNASRALGLAAGHALTPAVKACVGEARASRSAPRSPGLRCARHTPQASRAEGPTKDPAWHAAHGRRSQGAEGKQHCAGLRACCQTQPSQGRCGAAAGHQQPERLMLAVMMVTMCASKVLLVLVVHMRRRQLVAINPHTHAPTRSQPGPAARGPAGDPDRAASRCATTPASAQPNAMAARAPNASRTASACERPQVPSAACARTPRLRCRPAAAQTSGSPAAAPATQLRNRGPCVRGTQWRAW